MKPVWKWIIGIAVALFVIGPFATLFIMQSFYGNRMMSGWGSTWGMPMFNGFGYGPSMMGGGYGFFGFGMLFSALIQLGVLALIVLGIIWLVRELKKPDQRSN